MRKLFFLLLLGAFLTGQSQPQAMWQIWHNGNVDRWAYSWGDEFDDEKIDTSKWRSSYPWGRNYSGTCYQEYMTPDANYEFENGILKLVAKRETTFAKGVHYKADSAALQDGGPNLREWEYTSGMVFSQKKFKHGLFEISCKLPNGTGFWPAFWLFGGGPNEEIDIFEFNGTHPERLYFYMHCPKGCKGFGGHIVSSSEFTNEFHTYMGQWDEDRIYWHLNGRSYACWFGSLQQPASLIANFGIANNKPCPFSPAPNDTTPFPASYEIDYIRVWNRVEAERAIEVERSNENIIAGATITSGESIPIIKGDQFYNKKGKLKKRRKKNPMSNPAELFVRIFSPGNGKIILEFEGDTNIPIVIALQDIQNEIIFSTDEILGDKIEIDLSDLPTGDYILEGRFGENGRAVERIKLF